MGSIMETHPGYDSSKTSGSPGSKDLVVIYYHHLSFDLGSSLEQVNKMKRFF